MPDARGRLESVNSQQAHGECTGKDEALRYKLLGASGMRVSELSLGALTFGEDGGWGTSKERSRHIFDAYVAAGGNFIDVANMYGDGTSEKYIGEFIKDRDAFVIATKYSLNSYPGSPNTRAHDPNSGGNHRKSMVQSLEASLRRLGTDYVDLFWLHFWDSTTPIEEVMRALNDLVRSGKVLHIGISNSPAWVVSEANAIARLRGWNPFVALQVHYSLVERSSERELLPMARAHDIAVVPWGVLGGGVLSGKYTSITSEGRLSLDWWRESFLTERNVEVAREVQAVADEIGRTPAQVATNWVRQQPGVVIPIVGVTKTAQLQETLACLEFELSDEHLTRLDKASTIELGYPHDLLSDPYSLRLIHGEHATDIDNHHTP